jgi:hypothetical protein
MKKIIIILSILFTFPAFSQSVIDVEGDVSGVWSADTIRVIGNLQLSQNESLTIMPRVVIKFMGFYRFQANGNLLAKGLENDSIIFTVADTLGFYEADTCAGGWNGFVMINQPEQADSTIFEYCKFEYSKTDTLFGHGGVFYLENFSKVRFSNCNFSHNSSFYNGGSMYLINSGIVIKNSHFSHNKAGDEIHWGYGGAICGVRSNVKIYRNVFCNNMATGIGGACSFEFNNATCDANIFEENFAPLGGALGFLRTTEGGLISNNLINNNESTFFGGAIALVSASPLLINNTITNNRTIYGGGLYCNEGSCPKIYNSIFWGNQAAAGYGRQVYILDGLSAPAFFNCIFEHGGWDFSGAGFTGTYLSCTEENPLFDISGSFPFAPCEESPCIDMGYKDSFELNIPNLDLAGKNRICNQMIDIGAYEFQWTSSADFSIDNYYSLLTLTYFSGHHKLLLTTFVENAENFTLEVYNIKGQLVSISPLGWLEKGQQEIWISNLNIPKGIYLGRLNSYHGKKSAKFLVF